MRNIESFMLEESKYVFPNVCVPDNHVGIFWEHPDYKNNIEECYPKMKKMVANLKHQKHVQMSKKSFFQNPVLWVFVGVIGAIGAILLVYKRERLESCLVRPWPRANELAKSQEAACDSPLVFTRQGTLLRASSRRLSFEFFWLLAPAG